MCKLNVRGANVAAARVPKRRASSTLLQWRPSVSLLVMLLPLFLLYTCLCGCVMGLFHDPSSHALSYSPVTRRKARRTLQMRPLGRIDPRASSQIHLTHKKCEFNVIRHRPKHSLVPQRSGNCSKWNEMKWNEETDIQLFCHHIFMLNNLAWTQLRSYSKLDKSPFCDIPLSKDMLC